MGIVHTKITRASTGGGGSVKYDDTERSYAMSTCRRDDTTVVRYKKSIGDNVNHSCVAFKLDP